MSLVASNTQFRDPLSATLAKSSSQIHTRLRPIFVVGCQRSGTTALAVMLDRHSRIAMMPETQFFSVFVPQDRRAGAPMTHEALVQRAWEDFFIRQTGLNDARVLEIFQTMPATYSNLFRSLMLAYAEQFGSDRVAEKSCDHLFHAEELLALDSESKIICVLRDGRDVVRSLRTVPWGKDKPEVVWCRQWNAFAAQMTRVQRALRPDQFTIVRYEDLILHPEKELRRICEFIGEVYEPSQIERGTKTDVVPECEVAWKGKAREAPDRGRVSAWKKNATPQQIAFWNHHMARRLRRLGYSDTGIPAGFRLHQLAWAIAYIPFLPGIYPLALRARRVVLRAIRRLNPVSPSACSSL